jgi:predicted PurR-regulated permease PerM
MTSNSNSSNVLSWAALFRVVVVGLLVYFFSKLSSIIVISLMSLVLATTLYPAVKFLNKKISLTFSSIIVILIIFLPLITTLFLLTEGFANQLPDMVSNFHSIVQSSTFLPPQLKELDLTSYMQTGTKYLISSGPKITAFVTSFLAIIFLTLYILIDSERLSKMALNLFHRDKRGKIKQLFNDIAVINGHYIRGNLLISLVCTLVISVGLLILGVPYAILLGVFAGLLDLLPLVGAIIGAIPALFLGFAISPTIGIIALILFIVYQQFENHILAPNIYNKTLDLSPALSFIAVIIGATLFGIVGAFMALPIASSIPIVVKYIEQQEAENSK